MQTKLSIIVPFYNEEKTLREIVRRVLELRVEKEIVLVDDGSVDRSLEVAQELAREHRVVKVLSHPQNRGKGSAIITALPTLDGEYTIVQDADLEYDPQDILRLLQFAEKSGSPVVYGSRILGGGPPSYLRYYWGGRFLSWFTNLLFRSKITDEPTCYKLVRTDILKSLRLCEKRFGFCPELTGKLLRGGYQIVELPIRYQPRSIKEGKKIRWKDGLRAIWVLVRERLKPAQKTSNLPNKQARRKI